MLSSPYILAAGDFDDGANLKDALWAFDILKYPHPALHFALVGDGPQKKGMEGLARHLGFDDYRAHFPGMQPDLRGWVEAAEAVWITHRKGGTELIGPAIEFSKPIFAMRTADTERALRKAPTAVLVPFGDRVALASVVHKWLGVRSQSLEPRPQGSV